MQHPPVLLLLVVVGLASWPAPHVAHVGEPNRCLVYNEASLMVASLGASTDNALLTFGKYTFIIIEELTDRIAAIIDSAEAVGEHLCSEVGRLTAGNSWIITFVLYHPLALLASQANGTLLAIGSQFSALGATVQNELYAHTERVSNRLRAVVGEFMREVTHGLHNATDATPPRGACAYEYEQACSLANMRQMQRFVVRCVTRYGRAVLDRLVAIETSVLDLRWTVSRLLDGVDQVDQGSASELYNTVMNGIGVAMDNLSTNNATIYGELISLSSNITKCTDGIVDRMHASIEHVRRQIGTCQV